MPQPAVGADELSNLLGRWTTGKAGLVDDLVDGLVGLIDAGLLPAGVQLPPQRVLAAAIGVSRGTVTAAYAALEGRGYLLAVRGSGSRVRSDRSQLHTRSGGRLFSFTAAPADLIDLSTGALPGSRIALAAMAGSGAGTLDPYLTTDGYFPSGLPVLRQAIAEQLTRDGLPTVPQQVLVTAGAQQATWLAISSLVGAGDLVLFEEPTYRGALEVAREANAQLRGIPMDGGGLVPEQVRAALKARPSLLYCQTGIHNPTGRTMGAAARRELAGIINEHGLVTIEDRCSADLTLHGPEVAPGLAPLVEEELMLSIGTASKLFWGGIRVGWIRASETRVVALTELLKAMQLGCSVVDQLIGAELIRCTADARRERREMLAASLVSAEEQLHEVYPDWRWDPIDGGSGLWVDTGTDALALVEHGKRRGVKLIAGPSFSAHGGQRTRIRLPVWHEVAQLREGLERLR